jgi:hypothetical protein
MPQDDPPHRLSLTDGRNKFRVERLVGSLRSWGGRVLLGNGSLHEGEGEVVVIDLFSSLSCPVDVACHREEVDDFRGTAAEICSLRELRELRKLLKTSGTRVDLGSCHHGGHFWGGFWRIRNVSPRRPCTRPA